MLSSGSRVSKSLLGCLFVLVLLPAGSPAGRRFPESSRPAGAAVGCGRVGWRARAGQPARGFVFGGVRTRPPREAQGSLLGAATGPAMCGLWSKGVIVSRLVRLPSDYLLGVPSFTVLV